MPDRPERRSWVWLVPLALLVLLAALMAGELLLRSAIPRALSGEVTRIDVRTEDQPGVDDAWFVAVGSRVVRVDQAVGELLEVGDNIDKEGWSRDLSVNGEVTRIGLSPEARAAMWFVPLLLLVGTVMTGLSLPRRIQSCNPA